ncbi:endonuclease IV [Motilibacter rhizosphaerae]|uniref:Probable endonuclease 4 n=1 Tax=Motilibacter rhizosphaerae TaxID=598652 RepID=A0A4V2F3F7_9ACTN|nr:deoxyribonuclease IV [Motilibacter rhizosphaerae]RZS82953.1 endonuclease IV [Motilibacter rhizosphaerae]
MTRRNPVGAHIRTPGGLARGGLAYADALGAEVVQVFVGNPRGWAASPGDPAQDEAFRAGCAERGLSVFVHSPYLVNFGSPTPTTLEGSRRIVRHNLERAAQIGARGVVVHTGSAVDGTPRDAALRQVREAVLPLLDELGDDAPDLLLEPTAGQGQSLCALAADLGPYLDALDRHPRVGLCLDTCHAFAAGHDLAARGGAARLLDEVVAVAGPGRLRLVHANDSKDVCGAAKDRHERIGAGHIGEAPFRALLRHPATRGVPFVLETPGEQAENAADVALLKSLRR